MKRKKILIKKSTKTDTQNVVLKQQREREMRKKEAVSLKGVNEQGVKGKDKKKMRNEITYHLRDLILERDNYTCKHCGRSKETHPDLQLQIDHIIPLEQGGTNDLDNLQTLCLQCNRKKSTEVSEEVAEEFFRNNIEIESVKKFLASGDNNVKNYFVSEDSEKNRKVLYKYYELVGESCPKNCISCMSTDNEYLDCFGALLNEVPKTEISTVDTNTSLTTMNTDVVVSTGKGIDVLKDNSTKMKCNTCYLADRCGHFRINGLCVYDFNAGIDFTDAKIAVPVLIQQQAERVMRAMMFEKIDGGVPDKNTTTEMQILMDMYSQFHDMQQNKFGLNISIQGQTQGQQGSNYMEALMSKIFGGKQVDKSDEKEKVDIEPIDVEHTELPQNTKEPNS